MENINVQVYSLISEPISPIEKLKAIAKLGFAGAEFTADFTEVPVEEMKKVLAEPMPAASSTRTVMIPITSPLALSSGPPELPGLIAASVWIRLKAFSPTLQSWAQSLSSVR